MWKGKWSGIDTRSIELELSVLDLCLLHAVPRSHSEIAVSMLAKMHILSPRTRPTWVKVQKSRVLTTPQAIMMHSAIPDPSLQGDRRVDHPSELRALSGPAVLISHFIHTPHFLLFSEGDAPEKDAAPGV